MVCGGLRLYRRLSASDVFRRSRTPQTGGPIYLNCPGDSKSTDGNFSCCLKNVQNLQKVSSILWTIWTVTSLDEDVTIAVARSSCMDLHSSFGRVIWGTPIYLINFYKSRMVTLSFRRGVKTTQSKKIFWLSLYLQSYKSNCQTTETSPWIYIDCIRSFGSWYASNCWHK